MSQTKSFIEVLEAQIRTDLRREIEAEVRAEMQKTEEPTPRSRAGGFVDGLETWLLANVTPANFARKASYSKPAARPATPPPPRPEPKVRATTVEETVALELLLRNAGMKIEDAEFTEAQLKSVWRRAALKTHPDRFSGQEPLIQLQKAALFRELCDAYECLQQLIEKRTAA